MPPRCTRAESRGPTIGRLSRKRESNKALNSAQSPQRPQPTAILEYAKSSHYYLEPIMTEPQHIMSEEMRGSDSESESHVSVPVNSLYDSNWEFRV